MNQRLYLVEEATGKNQYLRLVRAGSLSQVAAHLIRDLFSIKVAKPEDVATAMAAGVRVENAGEEEVAK